MKSSAPPSGRERPPHGAERARVRPRGGSAPRPGCPRPSAEQNGCGSVRTSLGVVEDQAQRSPVTGPHGADAVAHLAAGPPLRRSNRAVPGGEHETVALGYGHRSGPRLRAGPLLDDDELAAGVVDLGPVQPDHDLQREDQVAVEVAVEARSSHPRRSRASAESVAAGQRRGIARAIRRSRRAMARPGCDDRPSRGRSSTGAARTPTAVGSRSRATDERSTGTRPARSDGVPCRPCCETCLTSRYRSISA